MNKQALADELNQLLATETRSLFRHLDEARPYLTPKTYRVWATLQQMRHVSEEHADRITVLLDTLELPPRAASFPTDVANYHFMSLPGLLPLLIHEKQSQIESYERAIEHAAGEPRVTHALESLLADNRKQLTLLESFQAAIGDTSVAGAR